MIKDNVFKIINQAKKIHKVLISPKNINIIFIAHFIGTIIALILLIVGLVIKTDKAVKLAIAITGIILLCLFSFFFYLVEYFRRKANYYFNQHLDLKFICESSQLKTNPVDISDFKKVINDYTEVNTYETYFANDIGVLNVVTNSNNFNTGYFIVEELTTKKIHRDLIYFNNFSNNEIGCDEFIVVPKDFIVRNHFTSNNEIGDYLILSNSKIDKSLIKQVEKLLANSNPCMIVKKQNQLNIFYKKPINYLLLAKKNFSFWKGFRNYLEQDLERDFDEFNKTLKSL